MALALFSFDDSLSNPINNKVWISCYFFFVLFFNRMMFTTMLILKSLRVILCRTIFNKTDTSIEFLFFVLKFLFFFVHFSKTFFFILGYSLMVYISKKKTTFVSNVSNKFFLQRYFCFISFTFFFGVFIECFMM